eukprot:s811_g20.t1
MCSYLQHREQEQKRVCPTKNDEIQRGQNGLKLKGTFTSFTYFYYDTREKCGYKLQSFTDAHVIHSRILLPSFSISIQEAYPHVGIFVHVRSARACRTHQLEMPNQKESGTCQRQKSHKEMLLCKHVPSNPDVRPPPKNTPKQYHIRVTSG